MSIAIDKKNVTVVIPAKNEVDNLREIIPILKNEGWNLLVVDGHSKDGTADLLAEFGVKMILDRKAGKGDAIRCAIGAVTTPIIVFFDADGSHDYRDINKLIQPIVENRADHVSGSRLIGGSSELHGGADEFLRLSGSAFITTCINYRYRVRLSDSQNGFRAIKSDVARSLSLNSNSTTIEQEMIMKSLKMGYRIAEVGTHEFPRKHGQSHIHLSKVFHKYVWSLITNLI